MQPSRRVLLLLATSALAARALLVPAVPRASPLALRTLRDIAVVGARLGEMQEAVRPAAEYGTDAGDELRTLSSTLNASTAEMVSSLQALQLMVQKTRFDSRLLQEPAQPAEGLKALRGQASTLHRQIDEQRELLLLLEEQESGAASRLSRYAFRYAAIVRGPSQAVPPTRSFAAPLCNTKWIAAPHAAPCASSGGSSIAHEM